MASSPWSNLKSDLEFLKQFPLFAQATADNSTPIPGYIFGEVNAVTFINNGIHCRQLVDYLLYRATRDSPVVKIKALKLLMHLAKNGHQNVTEVLKHNEPSLRELTGANGPPDPLHGKTYYENIRKSAKDLLSVAFAEEVNPLVMPQSYSFEGTSCNVPAKMGGYGSNASMKRMQGFGNTTPASQTMGEKIATGLTNFVDKMILPNSTGPKLEKQSMLLSESLPRFKPISVDKPSSDAQEASVRSKMTLTHSDPSLQSKMILFEKRRAYRPGKPGGGWDEDSDDGDENSQNKSQGSLHSQPSNFSILSNDSIDTKAELETSQHWVDEHKLVEDFTIDAPLEKLNWNQINGMCKRCSTLNCDKVIEFLLDKLNEKEENIKLRSLVFIEVLIHQDIISVESLIRIALPVLETYSKLNPSSVQIKSRKICMIIKKLSSVQHQNFPKQRIPISSAPA